MKRPLITLLSDFGTWDHYVAAMKGVILEICPEATIVDITHEIPAFQIACGAYVLAQACKTFAPGTIHVAVVDPGVGSARRAIAAEAAGQLFIGPDNGLCGMVLESAHSHTVHEITNSDLFRHPVSTTFHGRDIFAPVAAHLAKGVAISTVGPRLTEWQTGDFLKPRQSARDEWTGNILHIDHFGNIITNLAWTEFSDVSRRTFQLEIGSILVSDFADTYSDAPASQACVVRGSGGYLEISVKKGDAGVLVRAVAGDFVTIRWR